ncbi:hypothetical protein J6590_010053 [Homalodisca vitripennis]|nr:hypothetical protein J6590_098928 [Homalodisca vitripennis]KAG8318177.1 hypothetical protein J6590_010053 [Homalodisca vitripennis]
MGSFGSRFTFIQPSGSPSTPRPNKTVDNRIALCITMKDHLTVLVHKNCSPYALNVCQDTTGACSDDSAEGLKTERMFVQVDALPRDRGVDTDNQTNS